MRAFLLFAIAPIAFLMSRGGDVAPDESESFSTSASSVAAMLKKEVRIVNGTGLGSLTLQGEGGDEKLVRVSLKRAGESEKFECNVIIEAVSDQASETRIDCLSTQKTRDSQDRTARQVAAIVLQEHVRSTVNRMPYDVVKVTDKIIPMAVFSKMANN